MKRLATLVLAASFSLSALVSTGQRASATPFSDVPANHWAYQAIQSLAADGLVEGYPDGKFKGDRPLSRYEMAVIVARVIAKVQANGASKADLDRLQQLIDALKDELDALGVRVTNLEDSLDALDKRTKFAQSIELHGVMLPNGTFRQRTTLPRTIVNTTGATQSLYYGGTVANGRSSGGIDPFVNAFISSDSSNSPLTQNGSGVQIRYDDRFTFIYRVTDNLTVSIPFHLYSYTTGGEYNENAKFSVDPGVDVTVAKAGALSNLRFKFGILDNVLSSRTGLAYKAPDASTQGPAFENPALPYQKGFQISGVLNGLTTFQTSFTRVDPNLINTQTGVLDPAGSTGLGSAIGFNSYFFIVNPPQGGYTQTGPPGGGALQSNTFNAGSGPLGQVYLRSKAVLGTVYISQYNGTLYNNAGQIIGGGATPAPGFVYNDILNLVQFTSPLPAGSSVTISYVGLGATSNTIWQRYQVNARVNQKIKGLPGAEVGFEYNRIFDFDDQQTTADVSATQQNAPYGNGLVSDTVFGLDAQVPLPFEISGKGSNPVLFAEVAQSKYSPDYRNVAAISDTAGVVGLNFKVQKATGTIQYQNIGVNFLSGAPFRYYGNAPAVFSFWKLPYFPSFYGFGNNLGINQQFDNQFVGTGRTSTVAGNPNLTFLYPLFNPFQATGPSFFSAFTPNTRGISGNIAAPVRVGDLTVQARLGGASLQEIRPNSYGELIYGPQFASSTLATFNRIEGGVAFNVPAFSQQIALNLSGAYERLQRNDRTGFAYYPINPNTQSLDATSIGLATTTFAGGSQVTFFPNYIDMRHYTFNATAAVPVTKGVTLAGQYNQQNYGGSYGTTLSQNISQKKTFLAGTVTYAIPGTQSTLQFAARNQQYKDDVVPTFNFNQNRQDINFTIRF